MRPEMLEGCGLIGATERRKLGFIIDTSSFFAAPSGAITTLARVVW
jgi:hypothetical protein